MLCNEFDSTCIIIMTFVNMMFKMIFLSIAARIDDLHLYFHATSHYYHKLVPI